MSLSVLLSTFNKPHSSSHELKVVVVFKPLIILVFLLQGSSKCSSSFLKCIAIREALPTRKQEAQGEGDLKTGSNGTNKSSEHNCRVRRMFAYSTSSGTTSKPRDYEVKAQGAYLIRICLHILSIESKLLQPEPGSVTSSKSTVAEVWLSQSFTFGSKSVPSRFPSSPLLLV